MDTTGKDKSDGEHLNRSKSKQERVDRKETFLRQQLIVLERQVAYLHMKPVIVMWIPSFNGWKHHQSKCHHYGK